MLLSKKIFLMYSPAKDEKERICGHTFEVMDYYLFLKDLGYQCKIIIFDKFKDKEKLFNAWEDKYILNINYRDDIIFQNIKFNKLNNLNYLGTVIITSGIDLFWSQIINLRARKIISFQCEEFDYTDYLKKPNFYLLRDERIYENKNNSDKTFNYIKKLYFKKYKKFRSKKSKNNQLIYINSKLKSLSKSQIKKIINEYKLQNTLFISGTSLSDVEMNKYNEFGEVKIAPVNNLFYEFNELILTPNTRNFDCSPRFITECKYYDKKITFTFDPIVDRGLFWRWQDIYYDFDSLELKKGDLIESVLAY